MLDYWIVMDMPGLCHFIAQTYLEKVTKGFILSPRGSKMAVKRSAWWQLHPTHSPVRFED